MTNCIYIGPTLPGLPRFTLFSDGRYPPFIEEMIKKEPAIAGLIVPVSELAESRADLEKTGTPLYKFFNVLLSRRHK